MANSLRQWDFTVQWNDEPNIGIRNDIAQYVRDQPEYAANNWTPDRVEQRIQGLWESMRARNRADQRLENNPVEDREANVANERRRRMLESRRNRVSSAHYFILHVY